MLSRVELNGRSTWISGDRWLSREHDRRSVLVIIHRAGATRRLLDAVWTMEDDPRASVYVTGGPDTQFCGAERLLSSIGAEPVPWRRACAHRFGLVIAASRGAAERFPGPRIIVPSPLDSEPVACELGREETGSSSASSAGLLRTGDEADFPPGTTAFAHEAELARLATGDIWPTSVVVGDSTYDRLIASRPLRDFYRRALGVGQGQGAVVVAGRWDSAVHARRTHAVLTRLLSELPASDYRIFVLGAPRCVSLDDHVQAGLRVIRPEADWRAPLAAADWVVGDPGPLTAYGTVADVPVLIPAGEVHRDAGSPALIELADVAPRLEEHEPVRAQLVRSATAHHSGKYQPVLERLTSEPGRHNRNMRRLICQALGLRQPPTIPGTDPVSPSFAIAS